MSGLRTGSAVVGDIGDMSRPKFSAREAVPIPVGAAFMPRQGVAFAAELEPDGLRPLVRLIVHHQRLTTHSRPDPISARRESSGP